MDAHVDADGGPTARLGSRVRHLHREAHVPAARLAQDADRLQRAIRQATMPAHPNVAYACDAQPPTLDSRPVARRVLHAVEAVAALEAGLAALPLEELAKGAVEAAQHALARA